MLDTSLLGTSLLNDFELTSGLDLSSFNDIEFDGYSLQDANIIATNIVDSSAPTRELPTYRIPRNNGEGILGDYFRSRVIKVTGYIKDTTNALLEARLNTIKRRLTLREGNLDRNINGSIKRIKATLTNPDSMFGERQGYHITFCPFSFEFMSVEPMWHDLTYTSQTRTGVVSLVNNDAIYNDGTYKAPAVLIVIFDAATAVTAFQFTNNENGNILSITRSFVAGDVLIIDGEERSVTVNDVEVDYNGIFPVLEYGANSFTLTTTGAAVDYTSTIKYKKAYL